MRQFRPRPRATRHGRGTRPTREEWRRGLSIAELLVVVTIAVILMAIVIVAFGKVRALVNAWS